MTATELKKYGYIPNCSYTTKDGRTLTCYIKFEIDVNRFAYDLDGEVIISNIQGKADANKYFIQYLASKVNLDSKVLHPRDHLYAIHYHVGDRNKDMVMLRNAKSLEEVKDTWFRHYEYAIANHDYSLVGIKEIY